MPKPFILLDDARNPAEARPAPARLYRNPVAVFRAERREDIDAALEDARRSQREGLHVAGYLAYEAGLAFEPKLAHRLDGWNGGPLVWLAAFTGYEEIAAADVPGWLAGETALRDGPAHLSALRPAITRDHYAEGFAHVKEAISAGDIYQANLTFPLDGRWAGDPVAIYAAIRANAAAGYGALAHDGERHYLSFSPELFFALHEGTVTLRPMKGTRPRGTSPEMDTALAADLAHSEKDRAENLMITDLMRNDVSRLAVPGSVRVRDPFAIESYPTVHQMVSTVRARLDEGHGAVDLLRCLFPCGSITGAPKIRAMEIIDTTEENIRKTYCGAFGRIDPDGNAAFNVAIRTLTLEGSGSGVARMGVGSGLVHDSTLDDEWGECLVKGKFVTGVKADLRLIETMVFDPAIGVPLIEHHLLRLKTSAEALGFPLDRHALRNQIQAFCFLHGDAKRLRILLDGNGTYEIEGTEMPPALPDPVPVAVASMPVAAGDWRLRHKTTDRDFYDDARKLREADGAREVIFVRDDGLLTEGSFTNIFVQRGDRLVTPPLERGLLPGVLRASLIENDRAQEADLTVSDLADGFWIGNALRGLMPARLIDQD